MGKRRTNPAPKKAVTRNRDWTKRFLSGLADSGNVTVACTHAAIDRRTAYDRRESDNAFRAAWKRALDEAADLLEAEARRRAAEGVNEPVIHQGQLQGTWVGPDGEAADAKAAGATFIPLTVKKYSDTLLIFLLKAARPRKFRDNFRIEHTGKKGGPIQQQFDLSKLSVEELQKLRELREKMRGEPSAT